MEQGKLAALVEANNRYNEQLHKYLKSPNKFRDKPITLGYPTGEIEKHLGNSQEMIMRSGIIGKAIKGHETTVNEKDLENLPLKLANPTRVFKSKKEGSIVVAIDIKDNLGQPVVVSIQAKSAIELGSKQHEGNIVTSIHGRKVAHLKMWKDQNLELYDRQKEKSSIYSANPSTIPGGEVNRGLDNATKVAQENQNSKSFAEKMADLTRKNTEVLRARTPQQQVHRHKGKHI